MILGFFDNYVSKIPFYKTISESEIFSKDEVVKFFEERRGIYRVLDVGYKPDDNYLILFGVQLVGGHHGQHIKTYYEYLGCKGLMFNLFACSEILKRPEILDTIGMRFIIAPKGFRDMVQIGKFYEYLKKYSKVFENENLEILENPEYLPRVFLLCGDSIYKTANFSEYDPRKGYYKIRYESPNSCDLVLMENFYPHWKVKVNGRMGRVEIFRRAFMSVEVPKGSGHAEFFYESPLESLTLSLFFVGLAISVLLMVVRI